MAYDDWCYWAPAYITVVILSQTPTYLKNLANLSARLVCPLLLPRFTEILSY